VQARTAAGRSSAPRAAPFLGVLALCALVWFAFGSTLTSPFLGYDDPQYVTRNEAVRKGLSWSGVRWALTAVDAANWHPLTWLSHMLDVSLYGLDVRGHHATSLLLHAANTTLVFLLLRSATGAAGASLLVAALFTVHPTRLESVVWISERKDVLCAFFGLLAVAAWIAWVRSRRRPLFALAAALHAASLMAKPMLVTLPVLLLILDFWPLGRAQCRAAIGPLVGEKWPFFALSAVSGVITVFVQRSGGAVMGLQAFPLGERLANAPLAVGAYLVDFAWPGPRSIFYPHPGATVAWAAAAAVGILLALVTVATARSRNRFPYAFAGWAWFLVALLPVIGLVQVGLQARADRYTYLPYLGLFVAAVFAFRAGAARLRLAAAPFGLVALAVVAAAALTTRAQSAPWKDGRTLFEHARAVTGPNAVAEQALGSIDLNAGQLEAAERHFRSALDLAPSLTGAHLGLGRVLVTTGRFDEAATSYEAVLARVPQHVEAANNLAYCRLRQGDLARARALFARAVSSNASLAASAYVLGMLEAALGSREQAVARLSEAVRLSPGNDSWALDLDGARALARGEDSSAASRFRARLGAYHREAAAALQARGRSEEARSHLVEAERLESGTRAGAARAGTGARVDDDG